MCPAHNACVFPVSSRKHFAWRHYFIFLLLGYVLLWRAATATVGTGEANSYSLEHRPRRRIRWLLGAGVLLQVAVSSSILGEAAATALKKAQEHVAAQPQWKHPYFWAAWQLWGLGE